MGLWKENSYKKTQVTDWELLRSGGNQDNSSYGFSVLGTHWLPVAKEEVGQVDGTL